MALAAASWRHPELDRLRVLVTAAVAVLLVVTALGFGVTGSASAPSDDERPSPAGAPQHSG